VSRDKRKRYLVTDTKNNVKRDNLLLGGRGEQRCILILREEVRKEAINRSVRMLLNIPEGNKNRENRF